jgi:hypothetical protein
MQLPSSLPTDSLYKFQTLAGMLLVIGGMLLMEHSASEGDAAYMAAMAASDSSIVNSRRIIRRMDHLDAQIKAVTQDRRRDRTEIDSLLRSRILDSLRRARSDVAGENDAIERRSRLLDEFTERSEDMRTFYRGFGFALAIFGVLFTAIGFRLWETRLQVHLDRVARLEAERLEIEVSRLKAAIPVSEQSPRPE